MLAGLVLEEIAHTAQREHQQILGVARVRYKSDQRLNVGYSSVAASECFVACRVQKVDTIQVHNWEQFVDGEREQLINYLELLR
jgi:hypothetical protein